MKDMILAFVTRPEVLTAAAGVLATVFVWAWQAILARYADRKWSARARQLTPLAVDAWLRAEKAVGGSDAKAQAFAQRFAEQFAAQWGKAPDAGALQLAEQVKADLLLASKKVQG